ncbi:MAG: hypothetical protein IKG55_07940 [Solobacterium sp.]|nr:hypothetical protein [Solobacterium sp.]
MAEYIERREAIDAIVNCTNCGTPDELRKYVDKHSLENGWTGGILDAMGAVEDMPAADVVPVVRCRDCKLLDVKTAGWGTCKDPNGCGRLCGPDDYCSCGVKKE